MTRIEEHAQRINTLQAEAQSLQVKAQAYVADVNRRLSEIATEIARGEGAIMELSSPVAEQPVSRQQRRASARKR